MSAAFAPVLQALPAPAAKPVKLRVSNSAEASLRRGHPWLFAERIHSQSHEGAPGDLAVVFDRRREFVAVGLYDPISPLRMRALQARSPRSIDARFFAERIAASIERRLPHFQPDRATDGYRLVHGESDGMPGFIVDRYAHTAVVKLYSHAWLPHLRVCLEALVAALPLQRVVLRLGRAVREQSSALHGLSDGQWLVGEAPGEPLVFQENGLRFEVDPVRGQKTGFFLDQRENRARVETLARGRRVLNVFSYSGGFSLYAARGGAREVWSLDQSRTALACAERNFALNRDDPAVRRAAHRTLAGDAFERLAGLARAGERFDLVILDPPAFATRRSQLPKALEAYARLAHLGVTLLAPAGDLVLASCSSPVEPLAFRQAVSRAAQRAGRPLREISETSHALDHPLDFAESRYLKCIFARA